MPNPKPLSPGVTIITPTGDRPRSFSLCQWFLQRQSWSNILQWIVVDDGQKPTSGLWHEPGRVITTYIRRLPAWRHGQNTLAANLLAALPEVKHEYVMIWEDDDVYSPSYIERMAAVLDEAVAVGCEQSWYYNVPGRKYRVFRHPGRASLCHTAFRAEMIPTLELVCRTNSHIDVDFWAATAPARRRFITEPPLCIGMKGLPGRPGIGVGHYPEMGGDWIQDSSDVAILRSWIGKEVEFYYDPSITGRKHMSQAPEEKEEFESFYWKGQKRYKCNQLWESGTPCDWDTYDLDALREHARAPHVRAVIKEQPKRPQQFAPPRQVPERPSLFDGSGNLIDPASKRAKFKT